MELRSKGIDVGRECVLIQAEGSDCAKGLKLEERGRLEKLREVQSD